MKASERLLNTGYHLNVYKMINGKMAVRFAGCEVKDGYFLITTFGSGNTFEEACEDYIKEIQGKTLVFDAYGNRREVEII